MNGRQGAQSRGLFPRIIGAAVIRQDQFDIAQIKRLPIESMSYAVKESTVIIVGYGLWKAAA